MKIAILGSAGSLRLAPIGDESWQIFGCSPGVFASATRLDAWFELHRWEPGVIGKAATQKPWFSPEYVQWMAGLQCNVWMQQPVPEIPNSKALPVEELLSRYGSYFFTSSIAWMIACAIEDIIEARTKGTSNGQDTIGLWGVDMAAGEEYGYQRAGCQHFLLLAADLGIKIEVPPESCLLRPMPLYGISEGEHWMIKNTERLRELQGRLAHATQAKEAASHQVAFLQGAIEDMTYQMNTWGETRHGMGHSPELYLHAPFIREVIMHDLVEKGELAPPPPSVADLSPELAARYRDAVLNNIATPAPVLKEAKAALKKAERKLAKKRGDT